MVVMMKTGKPGGKPIRHRDRTGRDISTQFNEYMHDALKDIVGISIPQGLEASFRLRIWFRRQKGGASELCSFMRQNWQEFSTTAWFVIVLSWRMCR